MLSKTNIAGIFKNKFICETVHKIEKVSVHFLHQIEKKKNKENSLNNNFFYDILEKKYFISYFYILQRKLSVFLKEDQFKFSCHSPFNISFSLRLDTFLYLIQYFNQL